MNNKIREIMIKEFEQRKDELKCVKFKSKTRAYAVAGIDLIYNYMKDVLKIAGLKPYIEEVA
jgi:hypothetical protein